MNKEEGCDASNNVSQGCPIPIGNNVCGEANSLEIMKEFNRLYEDRMSQVDTEAGGDCLQEKIKLQQEWIRNLTQQNEMLVRAVQELEFEATERVQQLEEKLHKSAQCLCEVMKKYREHDFAADLLAEPLQKISHLEDDVRNVLEFIRRIRENEEWSIDGLFFYNISKEDLLGTTCKYSNKLTKDNSHEGEKMLNEKDRTVHELTQKLNYYNSFGDVEGIARELHSRREECESLKQDISDMRQALTEEVAAKHDQVVLLRKDVQILEDRCKQADKQTAFKEDIIRELRKEIKQLKQQVTEKYLNLVAEQLKIYFENHKNNSEQITTISHATANGDASSKVSDIVELRKYIKIKDGLLTEQLHIIKMLVTRLFTVDQGLKSLEEKTLSVVTTCCCIRNIVLAKTSCVADREMGCLQNKMCQLENENTSLKETLIVDKTHIEQLDVQFKNFLQERDELKRKNKASEKRCKGILKEKETLHCECETLKTEIQKLRERNGRLQMEVESSREQLEIINNESVSCQERMKGIVEDNRKTIEQILSLNEENRNLSESIDLLRQRSEYTTNFTQDEMNKLNVTIEELRDNLENTRLVQIEEETAHQNEIVQLNETIANLEEELSVMTEKCAKDTKTCKICRGRSKVGFMENSEVQANLESKESELVKMLNETKSKMKIEIEKRNNQIQMLKNKVSELESSLNSCEERAANLQEAVTLYSNSVNVLETAAEDAKIQIEQQKMTISNLQQALVEAKQEIDEMRKRNQENEAKKQGIITFLESTLLDIDDENDFVRKQAEMLNRHYDVLQDLNFTLEVEHCDSLQDIDSLENQLNKYKYFVNIKEEQMKKLHRQKKCYEEVIAYFKNEMGSMADQLNNLQELLTLSNETAQQETNKIMSAFMEVQSLNEKLSSQLCACEQKVQLENQMNQIHEARICELQQLVNDREMNMNRHDQAVLNIRKTLNESLKQNEDLQQTIVGLNETIASLQDSIKQYEYENCASKQSCLQFQEQIGGYCNKLDDVKRGLDEKTAECCKLEMAYSTEKRALKAAQKQLQETERMQAENRKGLVESLENLKQKLASSDENNSKLCEECQSLQAQLSTLSRKEAVKDLEIKRYRKIVSDLKATMMELNTELNKNLAQKELKADCKNAACRSGADKDDLKMQDICLSCPCEVEFYQKMVDVLKKSVTELKRKLNDTQQTNKDLEDEMREKDAQLSEMQRAREELNQQLSQSQSKDKKIAELGQEVERLSQEVQIKSLQLTDVKKSANEINGSKCVQLACAQEEIANLKNEMANILNRQYSLKRENEDLQAQSAQLHCTINCLSEKNKLFKDQIDQYLLRIKNLNTEKETLLRKNKELLSELRSIQSITCSADKQQRLTMDSLKQLEADIEDLKNNKEELCLESKNVIKNVRAWVMEQKKINSFIAKRERDITDTFKQFNAVKDFVCPHQKPTPNRTGRANNRSAPYNSVCTSPCSLGSQGTASYYDGESLPPSPDFGVNNEWYSTTFQTESDNDSEEDYCVNTLENLTQQMKKSNRIWIDEKRSRKECRVTKDVKQ